MEQNAGWAVYSQYWFGLDSPVTSPFNTLIQHTSDECHRVIFSTNNLTLEYQENLTFTQLSCSQLDLYDAYLVWGNQLTLVTDLH
jgi:hypothetical protein